MIPPLFGCYLAVYRIIVVCIVGLYINTRYHTGIHFPFSYLPNVGDIAGSDV